MYEYFGDCYPWDLAVLGTLNQGVTISDLDRELRPLRDIEDKSTPEATAQWARAWRRIGEAVLERAEHDSKLGFDRTAARDLIHASQFLGGAAAGLPASDPDKDLLAARAVECWNDGISLRGDPIEHLDIPYGESVLPALFRPADSGGAAPCVVTFNGLDSTKEGIYTELADDWSRRGLAVLVLDNPGSGEALRVHGLNYEYATEKVAAAAFEHLATRPDVDLSRVAVYGGSMGAFAAVRAACMEPRVAACATLGAFYSLLDVGRMFMRAVTGRGDYGQSSPQMPQHLMHVFGLTNLNDFDEVETKLSGMDLDLVIDKLTCPLLVLHGLEDRQVPADHGRRTVEGAVNSRDRTLIEFTSETGGSQHCSVDNYPRATGMVQDWLARVLRAE